MKKLKIKIYTNNLKIEKIDLESGTLFYENNVRVIRKNINQIEIICDECKSKIFWKTIPAKEYLLKENFFCRSCKQSGVKNHQYGKKWNDERREIRSNQMCGEKNQMFGKSFYDKWIKKYGEEIANNLLISHRENSKKIGDKNGMYNKSFYDIWLKKYGTEIADFKLLNFKEKAKKWLFDNPEHHKKMIVNSHIRKYKKTSIEIKVENYLKQIGADFKYNFIYKNYYQFDFLIKDKNIIIETHGDYWHANPLIYSNIEEGKKRLNETQEYKIGLDKLKKEYIGNDYKIIYLWETDIKNNNFIKTLKENGIY